MDDEQFGKLVAEGIDAIPEKYRKAMDNVAIVIEDQPTPEQLKRFHLYYGQTLFGLYEGIPRTKRGANYSMVLPDKITIFKYPILATSRTLEDVRKQVIRTVWHEVAHHFGLNHPEIRRLESQLKPSAS